MSLQYLASAGVVGALYYVANNYHYGNWGGPGWSGGKVVPDGSPVDINADARDPLDEIFKQHDIAYEDINSDFAAGIISEAERNARINEADRALVAEYRNLDLNSVDPQYRTEAAIYGPAAADLFTAKIALYEAGKAIQDPRSVPGLLLLNLPLLLNSPVITIGTGIDPDGDGIPEDRKSVV